VLFAMVDEPLGYAVELHPDDIANAVDLLVDHVRANSAQPSPTSTGTP
jgi:hypothetical protein